MGWAQALVVILTVFATTAAFWRDLRSRIDRLDDRMDRRLGEVDARLTVVARARSANAARWPANAIASIGSAAPIA